MKNIARSRLLKTIAILGFLYSCLWFVYSGGIWVLTDPPPPQEEAWPSWSPDSQQVAYECYRDGPIQRGRRSVFDVEGNHQSFYAVEAADICISDFDGHEVRLTKDPGGDWYPVWSPDGLSIAYLRQDGIYLITPDGQNRHQLVPLDSIYDELNWSPGEGFNLVWSPGGDSLLFSGCLSNPDSDIYVVDADTGAMTNLTPNSRAHEISPMWALNGTKVVFLSTPLSSSPSNKCIPGDPPHQLRVINVDGSDESVIDDKEPYYAFVSVSNSGQITFLREGSLYRINLESYPVDIPTMEDEGNMRLPSWSPDEQYLAYDVYARLKVLNVDTGEVLNSPAIEPPIDTLVWSPDSQKIAMTVSTSEHLAIDSEEHIYVFDIHSQAFYPLVQEQNSP